MEFLDFYKNKKVLVTGHTGFKGGWLTIWLQKLGAKVVGYSLDPIYDEGIYLSSGIQDYIVDYRDDIRDLKKLNDIFDNEKPEIVFHLAAQPLVLDSYLNPAETFEINVQGTVNVLEAIRKSETVKSAVIITTDKCYENKEWVWGYRENDPLGGHDPYSASKGAAEIVISSYNNSFFKHNSTVGIASARAGNVIGGGDWSKNRLIPDIIKSIKNNKPIEIRSPLSTRPWQHVLEPLSGYLLLGYKLWHNPEVFSGPWNFGPYSQEFYTVGLVVDKIINFTKSSNWIDISDKSKLHEANLLMLDISKAIQKLNWKPILNLEESIELTLNWYLNPTNLNIMQMTLDQLTEYENKWKLKNVN